MASFISQIREFSDLDFGLNRHPVTDDVMKKNNIEAIKASIRNLVLMSSFEKPFHPEIAGNIQSMLFENYTPLTERVIEKLVKTTIDNFEPRAQVNSVTVYMDDTNNVFVTIQFTPINSSVIVTFDILLERIR